MFNLCYYILIYLNSSSDGGGTSGTTSGTRGERRPLMKEQFTKRMLGALAMVTSAIARVHKGCIPVFPTLNAEELKRRNYNPDELAVYHLRAIGVGNGGGISGTCCTPDLVVLFGLHPRGTH